MKQEKTLQQIQAKIEFILSQDDLELPEPNEIEKRNLEAVTQHISSTYHTSLRKFKTRCWQAETLGLDQMTLCEVAKLLTGKEYTKVKTWWGWDGKPGKWERTNDIRKWSNYLFEYFYDSFENVWNNFGLEPLFVKGRGPTLILSRLGDFNAETPYAALFKIEQFKRLKMFNCFSILGTKDAFRSQRKSFQRKLAPVLVGCMYNLDYTPQNLDDPNYVAYYPLAKFTL